MDFTRSQHTMAVTLADYWGRRVETKADSMSRLAKRLYHSLDCNAERYKEIVLMKIRTLNQDRNQNFVVGQRFFQNKGIDYLSTWQKQSRQIVRNITRTITNPRLYDAAERDVPAKVFLFELLKKSDVETLDVLDEVESISESSSSESDDNDVDNDNNDKDENEDEDENSDTSSSASDDSGEVESSELDIADAPPNANKRVHIDLVDDDDEPIIVYGNQIKRAKSV